jgi:hypothetical protein
MRPSPIPDRQPRTRLLTGALLALLLGAAPGAAQTESLPPGFPLDAAQRKVLCGPRVAGETPATPLRLVGSEEGPLRRMYSPTEALIVGGGAADGLESGQLFAVRRPGMSRLQPPELRANGIRVAGVRTLGVIRLVSMDQALASAEVLEMCEGFAEGDYLVPFEPPQVPAAMAADTAPDYSQPGLVLFGDPARRILSPGDMVVIDRGAGTVAPGQAVTIYRPALPGAGPVHEVAWGIVMEVEAFSSMVRIDRAKDAVVSGDLVAPHDGR